MNNRVCGVITVITVSVGVITVRGYVITMFVG